MLEVGHCSATRRDGEPCGALGQEGTEYCRLHDPDLANEVAMQRQKAGQVAGQMRALRGTRGKLDSAAAICHFLEAVAHESREGTLAADQARAATAAASLLLKALEQAGIEHRLDQLEARHGRVTS